MGTEDPMNRVPIFRSDIGSNSGIELESTSREVEVEETLCCEYSPGMTAG